MKKTDYFKNLFLFGFILTVFFITSCGGGGTTKTERPDPDKIPINHPKELKQDVYDFDNPPIFRKDGQVTFIDGETNEPLSRIDVEIAGTDFQRQMGLMYRDTLEPDHGMLFLFNREIIQSFWMRNTLIPLDIIYINSSREIVDIHTVTETMSDKSHPSAKPAIYVVEVNAGYSEEHGIKVGDKIDF